MDVNELMQLAIEKASEGIENGQSPFGCAIARDGKLIACSHNTVVLDTDITAHAEVNAIRLGCQKVNDIFLTGAIVATTCEPCPMCMAALHWARVDTVYFGATIDDADDAGFNELQLSASQLLEIGKSSVKLIGDTHRSECQKLFQNWLNSPHRRAY
ncbi:MAG: guanine deaminase [Pirellulaceae bacterium]|jgi:tRNA(Arg) A34 adenosine deaminase TadA